MVTKLYQIWHHVVYSITHPTEPHISHRSDGAGNSYFKIYDPTTGKSGAFGSEQEIRAWLDQHHY